MLKGTTYQPILSKNHEKMFCRQIRCEPAWFLDKENIKTDGDFNGGNEFYLKLSDDHRINRFRRNLCFPDD
jgi:hypothetical protein